MLYLIKSAGYDEKDNFINLLKIGYAEDVSLRMVAYKLHNPTCKLLKTIEGSLLDEVKVQYHFRKYRYVGYGKEWFVYNKEIVDFFNSNPDLSKLEDLPDELSHAKKRLSNYITRLTERYFLSEVFNEDDKNFKDFGEIRKKIQPLYQLIDKTIREDSDVISGISSALEIDPSILMKLSKSKTGIDEVDIVLSKFKKLAQFPDRLKLICMSGLSNENQKKLLQMIPVEFSEYYYILGPTRCWNLGYRKGPIESEYNRVIGNQNLEKDLTNELYKIFVPGLRISKANIKETLRSIYTGLGYSKTPKATDLEEYFELRSCQITNSETGKIDNGFEIIKKR